MVPVWRLEGNFQGRIGSLLPPCGPWEQNSGGQACCHLPLSSEPSCWPLKHCGLSDTIYFSALIVADMILPFSPSVCWPTVVDLLVISYTCIPELSFPCQDSYGRTVSPQKVWGSSHPGTCDWDCVWDNITLRWSLCEMGSNLVWLASSPEENTCEGLGLCSSVVDLRLSPILQRPN